MRELTYLKLMLDKTESFDFLSNEEAGKFIKALLHYASDGAIPNFSGMEMFAFSLFKSQIDAESASYNEKCEKAAENGKRGGRPRKSDDSDESTTNTNWSHEKPNGFQENQTVLEKTEKSQEKNKNKNNTSQDNIGLYNNNDSACAQEDNVVRFARSSDYCERYIGKLTEPLKKKLESYQEQLPDDLICRAVDSAVSHGQPTWVYFSKILDNYISEGISSVEQAEERDEARKKKAGGSSQPKKSATVKQVTEMAYSQREYADDENTLPEWQRREMGMG